MSPQNPHPAVYYTLIPHPSDGAVLLREHQGGWALPSFYSDEDHFGVVGHLNQRVRETLGMSVTVLHCPYYREDPSTRQVHAVNVLEVHDLPDSLPAQTRWVGPDELAAL